MNSRRILVFASLFALAFSGPLRALDWTHATAARRIGGSHPVFKATVDGAAWIVKDPGVEAADEAFLSAVANEAHLTAPTYRFPDGTERAACKAAIGRLETQHNDAKTVACKVVMNNLDGRDYTDVLGHRQELAGLLTNERLGELGKLMAFQVFMVGEDRFQLPNEIPGNGARSQNSDNVRFAAQGNGVQAIDSSPDNVTLGSADAFKKYRAAVAAALDESIFAADGSDRLSQAVRNFFKAQHDVGAQGAAHVRHGLVAGIAAIAAITADRLDALAAEAQQHAGRAGNLVGNKTRFDHLKSMLQLFHDEAATAHAAAGQHAPADTLAVLLGVARVRLGVALDGEVLQTLQRYDRNPKSSLGGYLGMKERKRGWPETLLAIKAAKEDITTAKKKNRTITDEQVAGALEDVHAEGLETLAHADDAGRVEDFNRIAAKVLLRLQWLYDRDRVVQGQ